MNQNHDHKPGSKITPAARRRMQKWSAHNQLTEVLRELREEDPPDVPDADDSSATRDGVMR